MLLCYILYIAPSLVQCNINAYKCLCSCSVCSGSGMCDVMYLSLPQWYTEAPKHNLSRSSRVGFLDRSLLLVCLHLSGEDTPTWCYHGNGLSCSSCLQRGEQDLCVLILPVRVNSIASCESYNPRKYELRPYNCYFKLHNYACIRILIMFFV